MRILYLGDIVGKAGREMVVAKAKSLRKKLKLDVIIANGENISHGFGISCAHANELWQNGIDVITTGNHAYDKDDIIEFFHHQPRILRPINFSQNLPGRGYYKGRFDDGRQYMVVNVQGRLFMEASDDPIDALNKLIKGGNPKSQGYDAIIVDMHGEANSEKYIIANYFDGKISALIGSHTHIPTADAHILSNGTGIQADAGMCGDYNSVIGMKKEASIGRYLRHFPKPKLEPADGEATLCGTIIETDEITGLCTKIEAFRLGANLLNTHHD